MSDFHLPRSECALERVLDMNNIETTNVLLTMNDGTNTTHVTAASDDDKVTSLELDEFRDLARLDLELHGVVDGNRGIGVTDGTAIVGGNVVNALGSDGGLLDLQKLVGSLLRGDAVDGEAALDVVEETEVLARLLNRENICRYLSECILPVQNTQERTHEARGVGVVGANLVVDLDQALHDNLGYFCAVQRILQSVAQEDGEG